MVYNLSIFKNDSRISLYSSTISLDVVYIIITFITTNWYLLVLYNLRVIVDVSPMPPRTWSSTNDPNKPLQSSNTKTIVSSDATDLDTENMNEPILEHRDDDLLISDTHKVYKNVL
jgi:hypothetical protein